MTNIKLVMQTPNSFVPFLHALLLTHLIFLGSYSHVVKIPWASGHVSGSFGLPTKDTGKAKVPH